MCDSSFSWDASVTPRKQYEKYHHDSTNNAYPEYFRPDMARHGDQVSLHIGMPVEWEAATIALMDSAKEGGLGIKLDLNDG